MTIMREYGALEIALIIEMMANGIPAERGPIRALTAKLSGGRQPVS